MISTANSFSRKLQNDKTNARLLESEPLPKRSRIDVSCDDSSTSVEVKRPLKHCSEENVTSLVAKSFYGLIKSPPSTIKKHHQDIVNSSSNVPDTKGNNQENRQIISPMSHLDTLMLEKAKVSPVKQAVLERCSLTEFRNIYRHEYKQLETTMKKQNCRTTRNRSHSMKMNEEKQSDSSNDEASISSHDKICKFKTGRMVVSEIISDLESSSDTVKPHTRNNSTIPCNVQHKVNVRNTPKLDINKHVTKSGTHTENHKINLLKIVICAERCDKIKANFKENLQRTSPNKDSSPKLTKTPNSERRFFKSRSSMNSCDRRGVVLDKRFKLKFSPKMLNKDTPKVKGQAQKKALSSNKLTVSPTRAQMSFNATSPLSEKSAKKQQSSSSSGFTFSSDFLSSKTFDDDAREDDDDNLNLNKSRTVTYASASPQQDLAAITNTDIELGDNNSRSFMLDNIQSPAINDVQVNNTNSQDGGQMSTTEDTADENHNLKSPQNKVFPIFEKRSARSGTSNKEKPSYSSPPSSSNKLHRNSNSQMIIDAGQKKLGVTQCNVCSMVYSHGDSADETAHNKFHRKLLVVLKFPGWKKERVLQEYPEDLGRVILVLPDDHKSARKKVEEVNQLMGRELGFPDTATAPLHPYHKVFFYVEDKQITGCCVAEPVQEGYRIMPKDLDNSQKSGQRPWRCISVPEPVCVGISRLWVAAEKRKRKVSTKLVDCVRQWFNYGSLIPKHKIAFSDPTPDGCRFAQNYIGTATFLVYKFNYG